MGYKEYIIKYIQEMGRDEPILKIIYTIIYKYLQKKSRG